MQRWPCLNSDRTLLVARGVARWRAPQSVAKLPGRFGGVRASAAPLGAFACGLAARRAARLRAHVRAARLGAGAERDVAVVVQDGACFWGDEAAAAALGLRGASWREAAAHLCRKLRLAVPGLDCDLRDLDLDVEEAEAPKLVVLVNFARESRAENLVSTTDWLGSRLRPRSKQKKSSREVLTRCAELWSRQTAEDAFYALLFAIQFAVAPVPLLQEPQLDSPEKIWRLCTNCLSQAIEAGLDAEARACLACQSACDVRDQTQMYRCTVSHESAALAQLVRCFERRGIFDCDAQIPQVEFEPLKKFRGKDLTVDTAWEIMEGHWSLEQGSCSWRPVFGQNPAYDYFPCQYNSWYRDPRGNRGWYDPVFRVVTLDGAEVWRKRHYRVLPAEPGSFHLSTEDNGISLREFWRIVDAADDLAWAVLHYAGAARSVGQSYTGSLLVSKTGQLPELDQDRVRQAFRRSGVEAFELYVIHQPDVAAPLTQFSNLARYARLEADGKA